MHFLQANASCIIITKNYRFCNSSMNLLPHLPSTNSPDHCPLLYSHWCTNYRFINEVLRPHPTPTESRSIPHLSSDYVPDQVDKTDGKMVSLQTGLRNFDATKTRTQKLCPFSVRLAFMQASCASTFTFRPANLQPSHPSLLRPSSPFFCKKA